MFSKLKFITDYYRLFWVACEIISGTFLIKYENKHWITVEKVIPFSVLIDYVKDKVSIWYHDMFSSSLTLDNCLGLETEVDGERHCKSFISHEFPYVGSKFHSIEGKSTEVHVCSLPHFPSTCSGSNVLYNWWAWAEEPNVAGFSHSVTHSQNTYSRSSTVKQGLAERLCLGRGRNY